MSDYKRLTQKLENGYVMADCTNCPSCNKCDDITHYCQRTVKERLAEIEDKIENGTLIELPCKVGDKIYEIANTVIPCGDCIFNYKHKYVHFCTNCRLSYGQKVVEKEINNMNDYCYLNKDGKVNLRVGIFLTKAEAEQKLKELKGEV